LETVHHLFRRVLLLANGVLQGLESPRDIQLQANDDLVKLYSLLIDPNMPIAKMVQMKKIKRGSVGNDYWQSIIDIDSVRVYYAGEHDKERIKRIKGAALLDLQQLETATKLFDDPNRAVTELFEQHITNPTCIQDMLDCELTRLARVVLLRYSDVMQTSYMQEATKQKSATQRPSKRKPYQLRKGKPPARPLNPRKRKNRDLCIANTLSSKIKDQYRSFVSPYKRDSTKRRRRQR